MSNSHIAPQPRLADVVAALTPIALYDWLNTQPQTSYNVYGIGECPIACYLRSYGLREVQTLLTSIVARDETGARYYDQCSIGATWLADIQMDWINERLPREHNIGAILRILEPYAFPEEHTDDDA